MPGAMPLAAVTRTLEVTPEALWHCVRAFGDLRWIRGDVEVEVRGEGVGQERIVSHSGRTVVERLTALDEAARTLCYTVVTGNPFPLRDYEATIAVGDDGGRGRIAWSGRFETDADPDEIARGLEKRYAGMIRWIGEFLKEASA